MVGVGPGLNRREGALRVLGATFRRALVRRLALASASRYQSDACRQSSLIVVKGADVTAIADRDTGSLTPSPRSVAGWLFVCAGMVFAMALLGAITRLTESGLSMVEWRPLIGFLPPLSEAEWERVFALYRASPEYRLHNAGMDLAGFQAIFWWEWLHRVWGRLIGLVFVVPLLVFWLTGRLSKPLLIRLAGILALGALQGFMGWYMVMSGLVDRPSVSHYRLALHLGLAFLIYGALIWVALDVLAGRASGPSAARREAPPVGPLGLRVLAWAALVTVTVTVVWGAFVAGLDAGFAYNTWPGMAGHWIPPEIWNLTPAWLNAFENTAAVQFIHRWIALVAGLAVQLVWGVAHLSSSLPSSLKRHADALLLMVLVQISLGIMTLLWSVPVSVAAAHQVGAFTLVGLLIWFLHRLGRPHPAPPAVRA